MTGPNTPSTPVYLLDSCLSLHKTCQINSKAHCKKISGFSLSKAKLIILFVKDCKALQGCGPDSRNPRAKVDVHSQLGKL